jgi:hypothetical protein
VEPSRKVPGGPLISPAFVTVWGGSQGLPRAPEAPGETRSTRLRIGHLERAGKIGGWEGCSDFPRALQTLPLAAEDGERRLRVLLKGGLVRSTGRLGKSRKRADDPVRPTPQDRRSLGGKAEQQGGSPPCCFP